MASTALTDISSVAPLRQRQSLEFPYKHSTGETVGRFLAALKEQKKIWGQRVNGQGVVVPPLGYSEIDGSNAGEWVEVKDTGKITAAARVDHPIERLHPSTTPFAFVLVKLDGADTALAHIVKDDLDRVAVGARVEAVWAGDEARVGSIRDIACFRIIADAPPVKAKPAPRAAKSVAKAAPSKTKKASLSAKTKRTAKKPGTTRSTKPTKTAKATSKPAAKKAPAAKKTVKVTRAKATQPARIKTRSAKPTKKKPSAKKPARKPAKAVRAKTSKRPGRR
jgi:uncharacterized OB-fold protein